MTGTALPSEDFAVSEAARIAAGTASKASGTTHGRVATDRRSAAAR
jgi:hypothetical protein